MKISRILISFLSLLLLLQPASAKDSLAFVTKGVGQASSQGQQLELLSYLADGDIAKVTDNSQFIFSYVKGGLRATAVGPCQVKFTKSGPIIVSGETEQLTISRPKTRVGVDLPPDLDWKDGGVVRRGDVAIHLSRKVLPGEHRVAFSGLPSYQTFKLTVNNASTYLEVFEDESTEGKSFLLPKGTLRPGQSYDFFLQATTESGQTREIEKEKVVVLSEDIASRLSGLTVPQNIGPENFVEAVELLSIYLKHDLDVDALQITQQMLKSAGDHSRLLEIEQDLKQHLQLTD